MSKKQGFVIPQIEEEVENKVKKTPYATPYEGTKAKDEHVFPYVQYGNNGKQYQGLNTDYKRKDDLNPIANETTKIVNQKEEEKYSPERIPSYYRSERGSGINRTSIIDLTGIKLSEEEIIERNRRHYGKLYKALEEQDKKANQNNHNQVDNYQTSQNQTNQNQINHSQVNHSQNNHFSNNHFNNNHDDNYQDSQLIDKEFNFEEEFTYIEPVKVSNTIKEVETKKENIRRNESPKFFHLDNDEAVEEVYNSNDFEEIYVEPIKKPQPAKPMSRKQNEAIKESSGIKFGDHKRKYIAPPLEILNRNALVTQTDTNTVNYQISSINRTLTDFKVGGKVINYTKGPTVTQFEVKLDPGVNVNKVTSITKNLQMNLESESIRIEAPIPGKATIGIEAPNIIKDLVLFGSLVSEEKFLKDAKPLNMILGISISGEAIYANLADMPHCLVAGATGGGKTVCIYSMIVSMLYKASPEEVKMILIDPKRNELIYFENIPHLATPIIDDPKLATASLKWAVDEMERRYDFLKTYRKRTIADYNAYAIVNGLKIIPYIVIVIDEFADLMNTASETFEVNVQRLTQKARSAGIHLIIATQRPSTDVIKGTIKANIPTRIAFSVQTSVDSITILDHVGAEKLLGKGDMLYTKGNNDIRIQGSYIHETELDKLADYFYEQNYEANYIFTHDEISVNVDNGNTENEFVEDELLEEVAHFVFRQRKGSANQIQTTYGVGFNRANSLINTLATLGILRSENIPGKAREVIIKDIDELEEILRTR